MPKGQKQTENGNKYRGKAKKAQESNDITSEVNVQSKDKIVNRKGKKEEEMSALSNLVHAARIVESNSPKVPKKAKGKTGKANNKEPQKPKRKPKGGKGVKSIPKRRQLADDESTDEASEGESDEEEIEKEEEIQHLKKSMNMMMERLERLESSKRKRKKKVRSYKEKSIDKTDNDDDEYVEVDVVTKPAKSLRKEEGLLKIKDPSESTTSVTPDNSMPNMGMFQYQQMLMMQQHMSMMNNMYNPSFMMPSMMNMMPPVTDPSISVPSSIVVPTNAPAKGPTGVSAHALVGEPRGPAPLENYVNVDISKLETKKREKQPSKISVDNDNSRDGGESDASEVYEPNVKDNTNLEKYLNNSSDVNPTQSFLGFVDDINNEGKSIQSMVVSSSRKNAADAAKLAKAGKVGKEPITNEEKSVEKDHKKQEKEEEEEEENQQGGGKQIAGILMNLMPQSKLVAEDGESKNLQVVESMERPEINDALRMMISQSTENKEVGKALDKYMLYQQKQREHLAPSPKHFVPVRSADKKVGLKRSSEMESPPETKPYVENSEWLRECAQNLYLQDQDGDTILHILIAKEEEAKTIDVIKRMRGYRLDILNALGQTPLHLAMYTKNIKIIETLLQHGANISLVDAHGNSPIHIACEENSLEMLKIIFDYQLTRRERYEHIMQIRNNQGMAAIHIATNKENLNLLKFLVDHKIDLNIQEGRSGNTPLVIALAKENWELALFFLDSGANVNIPNFSNCYPLHFAVQGNQMDMVKALLFRGAEMGNKANEYEQGSDTSGIKSLLAKEMRKRRRQKLKQESPKSY